MGPAFMVYIVFDKKSTGSGIAILVNKLAVNGDFNQKEHPLVGPSFATISWGITLTKY